TGRERADYTGRCDLRDCVMADYVSPNLPSRNFDKTEAFYAKLGFKTRVKIDTWMILERGKLVLEFFPMPQIAPDQSWFGACVRVDDLEALHTDFSKVGLPGKGVPRITSPYL